MVAWIERVLLGAVGPEDREAVSGDLAEEALHQPASSRPWWRVGQLIGVAFRYQVEPYRDPDGRIAAATLAAGGALLLWGIRAAAWDVPPPAELYRDPISRMILAVWASTEPVAASAAGLLVGRLPLPDVGTPLRWHAGVLLAIGAGAGTAAPVSGLVAGGLLLSGVWLGDRARGSA